MRVTNISGAQELYVFQNSKKTLAVRNCLQLAVWDVYTRLHNPGGKKGKDGNGDGYPSTLRFTAIETGEKEKGKGSKTASFNLTPADVRLLFFRLNRLNKPTFDWAADRLHAFKKGKDGRCPMNRISIQRIPQDAKGEPYRSPWFIKLSSGTATPSERDNGSVVAAKGSWKPDTEITIMLSDDEYFRLLSTCVRGIEMWEMAYGIPHLRSGDVLVAISQAKNSAVDENGVVAINEKQAQTTLIRIAYSIVDLDVQTKEVTTDYNNLVDYFSRLVNADYSAFRLCSKKASK